jgi:cytochrome c551/c552
MMKTIGLVFMVSGLWLAANVFAQQEGGIFESLHCGGCHKADVSTGFPSLKDIAGAYQGKQDQLIKYLKGEGEPIVKPAELEMMKRNIEKTKLLADADRKALADFIMSHGAHGE